MNHFLLPYLSESQPKKVFNTAAAKSLTPSITPMKIPFVPKKIKNKGNTESIILLDISVKRLIKPNKKILLFCLLFIVFSNYSFPILVYP